MKRNSLSNTGRSLRFALKSLNTSRNASASWVLVVGVIGGSLCSLVVMLDWVSGTAFQHGARGVIMTLLSTILFVGLLIDSEVRLSKRLLHKSI